MASIISNIFNSSTSRTPPCARNHTTMNLCEPTFLISKGKKNHQNMRYVRLAGAPPDSTPMFTVSTDKKSKPMVVLYIGEPAPHNVIGTASYHNWSSKADVEYRSQLGKLKLNALSGNQTLDFPSMAAYKWHPHTWGDSMELRDPLGTALGKFKHGSSTKQLKISGPCDDYFVGMALLTAFLAKLVVKASSKSNGLVADVVGAAVGG